MAQVSWTPQAENDLDAIAEFIAEDSPHFASLFVLDILQAAEQLVKFPRSGRMVTEIEDQTIREIIQGNYPIIYRLRAELVEILTVFHGAQLFDAKRFR